MDHPSHDILVPLRRFRQRAAQYKTMLRPLAMFDGTILCGCEALYHDASDNGFLVLRYSAHAVSAFGVARLQAITSRSGLPIIVPARLLAGERQRLESDYLAQCAIYVQQYPNTRLPAPQIERAIDNMLQHIEAAQRPTATIERLAPWQSPNLAPRAAA